jgi:hypothetical protein
MRNLVILLAVVAVVFLAVVVLGGNMSGPRTADEFEPGSFGDFVASLPLPGRPKLRIADQPFVVAPLAGGRRFHVPASDAPTRVVTLALLDGSAARARYECAGEGDCSASLCLVRQGSGIPGGCRADSKPTGSLVIVKAGGAVIVEAIDLGGVRVESR